MKRLCIGLIRIYQRCISPYNRPCCRYYPTCSAYAVESFEKRGFFVGFALTLRRILRCNPFGGWGYDPVPEPKYPKIRLQPTRRKHGDAPDKKTESE